MYDLSRLPYGNHIPSGYGNPGLLGSLGNLGGGGGGS